EGAYNHKNSIYLQELPNSLTELDLNLFYAFALHELIHGFYNLLLRYDCAPHGNQEQEIKVWKELCEIFLDELALETDPLIIYLLDFSGYRKNKWSNEIVARYAAIKFVFPEKKLNFSKFIIEKLDESLNTLVQKALSLCKDLT